MYRDYTTEHGCESLWSADKTDLLKEVVALVIFVYLPSVAGKNSLKPSEFSEICAHIINKIGLSNSDLVEINNQFGVYHAISGNGRDMVAFTKEVSNRLCLLADDGHSYSFGKECQRLSLDFFSNWGITVMTQEIVKMLMSSI